MLNFFHPGTILALSSLFRRQKSKPEPNSRAPQHHALTSEYTQRIEFVAGATSETDESGDAHLV
jgi:hypothetical protein